jgi:uncharacterized protein YabE (DUF348 family)
MKRLIFFILGFSLAACQPAQAKTSVVILDGDKRQVLQSDSSTPAAILAQAGLSLAADDRIQFNGADLPADFSLPPGGPYTLQIRRAHTMTLLLPDTQKEIQSAADTVGQVLARAGLQLYAADTIAPPPESPFNSDMRVTYRPARDLSVSVDGRTIAIKSSALLVGQALVTAGITLVDLDKSLPPDDQALPSDGRIKVIRVNETVTLVEKSIPFPQKIEYSSELAAGAQKVVQAGQPGLTISRVRVRYEDGVEVARTTEAESVARQPQAEIITVGTQAQVQTLSVPGGQIEYWRAVQMYATAYSPCRSGTPKCSYGTASGIPVKQGVVALVPSLYNQLAGSQVYIPGYGMAVIADVGGGFPDGRLWIDLGYSDADYQSWSGMVTVYFLAPAPASIPAGLR